MCPSFRWNLFLIFPPLCLCAWECACVNGAFATSPFLCSRLIRKKKSNRWPLMFHFWFSFGSLLKKKKKNASSVIFFFFSFVPIVNIETASWFFLFPIPFIKRMFATPNLKTKIFKKKSPTEISFNIFFYFFLISSSVYHFFVICTLTGVQTDKNKRDHFGFLPKPPPPIYGSFFVARR